MANRKFQIRLKEFQAAQLLRRWWWKHFPKVAIRNLRRRKQRESVLRLMRRTKNTGKFISSSAKGLNGEDNSIPGYSSFSQQRRDEIKQRSEHKKQLQEELRQLLKFNENIDVSNGLYGDTIRNAAYISESITAIENAKTAIAKIADEEADEERLAPIHETKSVSVDSITKIFNACE